MRWAKYIAQMGKRKVHTGFRWGNLRERDYLEDLSICGSIKVNGSSRSGIGRNGAN